MFTIISAGAALVVNIAILIYFAIIGHAIYKTVKGTPLEEAPFHPPNWLVSLHSSLLLFNLDDKDYLVRWPLSRPLSDRVNIHRCSEYPLVARRRRSHLVLRLPNPYLPFADQAARLHAAEHEEERIDHWRRRPNQNF